jgi:ribonucleoside-diphosphate reductase alpha chain
MKLKTESRNFETLYFAAVTASMELAKEEGPSFEGISNVSRRISAQFVGIKDEELSGRWDWAL